MVRTQSSTSPDSLLWKDLESLAVPSEHAAIKGDESIFTVHYSKASEQQERNCFCWKEKNVKLLLLICIHKSCLS